MKIKSDLICDYCKGSEIDPQYCANECDSQYSKFKGKEVEEKKRKK